MGDDRAPVYYDDDTRTKLVIRASAFGHPCLWELGAAGQNVDDQGAPAFIKRAYAEGTEAEGEIIRQLVHEHGFAFRSHQEEGELLLGMEFDGPGMVVVRYHPDGIAEVSKPFLQYVCGHPGPYRHQWGEVVVVEVKNLSNSYWQQAVRGGVESTITEYPWQLSTMMISEQMPGLWVCRNKGERKGGKKVYCSDEGKLFFQYVPEPQITYQEMMVKGQMIKEVVDGEDLLTSDRQCDTPDHFPCLYLHVRPVPEDGGKVAVRGRKDEWVVPPELEDELEEALRDHLLFKGQADEAAARAKEATKRVVALIPEGIKRVRTSKRTFNVGESRSNRVLWDEMSPELKAAIDRYRRSEVTGRHVRDFKSLE